MGYEVVLACIDDHRRPAYAEVHLSESGKYAALFFPRALRCFESLGIRCKRFLTGNAKRYTQSKLFLALCEEHQINQSLTRPFTPKTNGKAERFIQTPKGRWAYRRPYRSSAIRAASLPAWITHYNRVRPHQELGKNRPSPDSESHVNDVHRSPNQAPHRSNTREGQPHTNSRPFFSRPNATHRHEPN